MGHHVKKEKGFTIIEVVLVLAIAALIFLIIFLALPALQRSQRDQQRRTDLGRIIAASNHYKGNNNGATSFTFDASGYATAYDTGGNALYQQYLDSKFSDPSANTQYAILGTGAIIPTAAKQIAIYKSSDCTAAASATGTKIVFRMFLESGGYVCQVN